jgi:hypothetical protein
MSNTIYLPSRRSSGKITRRKYSSPRREEENKKLAERADTQALLLVGETNLLKDFIYERKCNENISWEESIKDFIKYHPKLREEQKAFLTEFKNLETIEERIKSNIDTIKKAVDISRRLRFTVVKKGGKKYRKHKSSKHKSSKHKSSKHKSR